MNEFLCCLRYYVTRIIHSLNPSIHPFIFSNLFAMHTKPTMETLGARWECQDGMPSIAVRYCMSNLLAAYSMMSKLFTSQEASLLPG